MVSYLKIKLNFQGAERREQSREERTIRLYWVGVSRVERIRSERCERIKHKLVDYIGSNQIILN